MKPVVSESRGAMTLREIRTGRLLLRAFRPGDEEALQRLWNDPEVRRYLWDDKPVPPETVRDQIAWSIRSFDERGFGHFAVSPLDDPRTLIGFAGLRPVVDSGEIELLYALLPSFLGRGLATEAARAVLRFGFEVVGLEAILAGADPPNRASFRVMERLGMSFLREALAGGRPARYYRPGRVRSGRLYLRSARHVAWSRVRFEADLRRRGRTKELTALVPLDGGFRSPQL